MTEKAYILTVDEDSQVIFATSEEDAWAEAGIGCEGCSFNDCACYGSREIQRKPIFDQYGSTEEIPLEAYLNDLWAMQCQQCAPCLNVDEVCGPGDWQVVGGRALCNECADLEKPA